MRKSTALLGYHRPSHLPVYQSINQSPSQSSNSLGY